ncbi:MAG: SpoIIE family protein phosphatase [Planctomycetota bacterium]
MEKAEPLAILRQVSGANQPETRPLVVTTGTDELVIGRDEASDWRLTDPRVSRTHAVVTVVGEQVMLRDAGSRHGTAVNDRRLEPGQDVPITGGDRIRFGAVQCSVQRGGSVITATRGTDDPTRVSVVPRTTVGGLAQERLAALMEASKRLARADSPQSVGLVLVETVLTLPECSRVGVLRPIADDEYELIASSESAGEELHPSHSMLRKAAAGELVQLTAESQVPRGAQSIISMGVRSAVCVPIHVSGSVMSLLYLDTRRDETEADADTVAFCDALSAVAGLAFERIEAQEADSRRQRIELDLRSARDAQRMLFPPNRGTAPGVGYVFESVPGRFVGGDLFDLFELDRARTAFFLGDALGKGAGAGVLMVAAQSLLRGLLESGCELAHAISQTNASLALRTESDKFVTLLAGIWDTQARTLDVVDAGHGMLLLRRGPTLDRVKLEGGLPLGIDRATSYSVERFELPQGARAVAFSDGVTEQTCVGGTQFGIDRVAQCLQQSQSAEDDVLRIIDAVTKHAASGFDDDLTVASIELLPQRG